MPLPSNFALQPRRIISRVNPKEPRPPLFTNTRCALFQRRGIGRAPEGGQYAALDRRGGEEIFFLPRDLLLFLSCSAPIRYPHFGSVPLRATSMPSSARALNLHTQLRSIRDAAPLPGDFDSSLRLFFREKLK